MGSDLVSAAIDPEKLEAALIAEKFSHAIDLLQADIDLLRVKLEHQKELYDGRLTKVEGEVDDHEQRLRAATDGVTQFKTFHTLASGGSGFMSLVALLKAFLGG